MRALLGLLLLVPLVAGCTGGTDDPPGVDPATGGPEAPDAPVPLELPTWSVGRYWTFSTPFAGEVTYVVAGEDATSWTMATDNPQVAFFDAQNDVSFLGSTRRSDLAGSQGSDAVAYFDFPLEAGKTWTTTWDGLPVTVEVLEVAGPLAVLEARAPDRTHVSYTYDAAVGWFSEVTFHDENGTAGEPLRLLRAGEGFAGEVVHWVLGEVLTMETAIDGAPRSNLGLATIAPGTTDLHLTVALTCTEGSVALDLRSPENGVEASWHGSCPGTVQHAGVLLDAPPPGDYTLHLVASAPGGGHIDLTLLARTLVRTPVRA